MHIYVTTCACTYMHVYLHIEKAALKAAPLNKSHHSVEFPHSGTQEWVGMVLP